MIDSLLSANPLQVLMQALSLAYPDRHDIAAIEFDGTHAQAWLAFTRILGVSGTELARTIAPHYGVPAAGRLDSSESEALAKVPVGFCQQHGVLPLRVTDGRLQVATAHPFDQNVAERLRFLADMAIDWLLAPPQDIEDAVVLAYAREATRQASDEGEAISVAAQATLDDNVVVRLGRALLEQSIDLRASDLHIQPLLGAFVARIRVDGQLRRLTMLPDAVASSLIRHLKARSGMESTNTLVPQDGRMALVHAERDFDLRVSSLPTSRGERLVIRFLDQSKVHRLGQANFSLAALHTLRRGIARPAGMVIMTGPTGCGKTSTLYGMLGELNRSTVNIITVENPVEYRIPGISQVEVNDKAGRTFMAALRSILRQDPDVVLIGEIRDAETAEIACQAALTGHLVLSTMHTNDALTAIPRLLNLGVAPTILADSLAMVVAQRLCRSLCPQCKTPVADPLTPVERAFFMMTRNRPSHRAVGCKACDFTGFYGRLPVVDIIETNKRLRDAVALGESRLETLAGLREGGLSSLAASGSLRVISGETTVSELMDAIGPGFWPELAQHYGSEGLAEALALAPQQIAVGQSVLLIGDNPTLAAALLPALDAEGLQLRLARDAEEAKTLLQQNEDIAFKLSDLPEDIDLDEAIVRLRRYRRGTIWARLPSLVLLPPALAGQQAALKQGGVLGSFMTKPVDPQALVAHIRKARAR